MFAIQKLRQSLVQVKTPNIPWLWILKCEHVEHVQNVLK